MSGHHGAPPAGDSINISERGALKDGQPQTMDSRLFMQLLAFEHEEDDESAVVAELGAQLEAAGVGAVIYADVNHSRGLGVVTWSENPGDFLDKVRPVLAAAPIIERPELSMLGRTYSSGYEQDLKFWLKDRPRNTLLNPEWPWAVWYPLRRSGAFEQLEPREKGGILREHAEIGKAYGVQDLAHDVRLACHGLDENDNEFVIGLVGKDLYPLSHVVQRMRGTTQTSKYIVQMGPFFVGRAVFQTKP
jgi:chlorite dismutase